MIAVALLAVVVFVLVKRRQTMRRSTLDANQAAQQVHSPYAALHPRDSDGLIGRLLNTFSRGSGF